MCVRAVVDSWLVGIHCESHWQTDGMVLFCR